MWHATGTVRWGGLVLSLLAAAVFLTAGCDHSSSRSSGWDSGGSTGGFGETDNSYDDTPAEPVPEPATVLLLLTGAAGIAVRYRRSRRNRP